MKIQITTSTWSRGGLIEPQVFDIESIRELKEAVESVVVLLREERKTMPSWKTGFDPKFNVTYRITNSNFSSVMYYYSELQKLPDNKDLTELFADEVTE